MHRITLIHQDLHGVHYDLILDHYCQFESVVYIDVHEDRLQTNSKSQEFLEGKVVFLYYSGSQKKEHVIQSISSYKMGLAEMQEDSVASVVQATKSVEAKNQNVVEESISEPDLCAPEVPKPQTPVRQKTAPAAPTLQRETSLSESTCAAPGSNSAVGTTTSPGSGGVSSGGNNASSSSPEPRTVIHHHPPKDTMNYVGQSGTPNGSTLLIAYFPWEATEQDVAREFNKYCSVKKVHLVMDKDRSRPRCFGFVKFASHEDAKTALDVTLKGLVTLNDSRNHIWHLKAEWAKTGDMIDDNLTKGGNNYAKTDDYAKGGYCTKADLSNNYVGVSSASYGAAVHAGSNYAGNPGNFNANNTFNRVQSDTYGSGIGKGGGRNYNNKKGAGKGSWWNSYYNNNWDEKNGGSKSAKWDSSYYGERYADLHDTKEQRKGKKGKGKTSSYATQSYTETAAAQQAAQHAAAQAAQQFMMMQQMMSAFNPAAAALNPAAAAALNPAAMNAAALSQLNPTALNPLFTPEATGLELDPSYYYDPYGVNTQLADTYWQTQAAQVATAAAAAATTRDPITRQL